jgi:histidine ammonia-lyase
MHNAFKYGEDNLSIGLAIDICNGSCKGYITDSARRKITKNRSVVENMARNKQNVYGINTGFGPLCTTIISEEDTRRLQYNLLKSHSVGVGPLIDPELTRLMLILKVHSLAIGNSGISIEVLDRILWFIEKNVIPCVPSQGSVGASGDLAPLAHLFLPLIGLGKVFYKNEIVPASQLLKELGIEPVELGPKEGLALINGTQFMIAHAVKFAERLQNCLDNADIIAAMNLETMLCSVKAFDKILHKLRPYKGNIYVAERIRMLLKNSQINASHKYCGRVQDPYSIRCIPQVHGASRNAWLHLKEILSVELNSVTDNPVILDKGIAINGGNFHGQPAALPIDYATLAASELGNISDRRIYLSLEDKIEGLPKLLMKETGLNSGFMITQYTTAALVSENKSLCYPASADSIPTSLGQEDHVSMGSISARKALEVIENLENILGIEMFCAAQGFDFRKPLKSGILIDAVHDYIRSKIPFIEKDIVLAPEMEKAIQMVKNKEIINVVNETARKNKINFKNQDHEIFGIY